MLVALAREKSLKGIEVCREADGQKFHFQGGKVAMVVRRKLDLGSG